MSIKFNYMIELDKTPSQLITEIRETHRWLPNGDRALGMALEPYVIPVLETFGFSVEYIDESKPENRGKGDFIINHPDLPNLSGVIDVKASRKHRDSFSVSIPTNTKAELFHEQKKGFLFCWVDEELNHLHVRGIMGKSEFDRVKREPNNNGTYWVARFN